MSCARAQDARPIPAKELAEFLGPVSSEVIHWTKKVGPDFDVYYGHASPSVSGDVGFYLGGHPDFEPDAGSSLFHGKLGIFSVRWHRLIAKDGSIRQNALIRLADYLQVDIWVSAKTQADLDRILAAVAQLPTFTEKPKPIGPK